MFWPLTSVLPGRGAAVFVALRDEGLGVRWGAVRGVLRDDECVGQRGGGGGGDGIPCLQQLLQTCTKSSLCISYLTTSILIPGRETVHSG